MSDSCLEERRVKLLVFPLSALLLPIALILIERRLNLVYLCTVKGFVERGVGRTWPSVWSVRSNRSDDRLSIVFKRALARAVLLISLSERACLVG